MNRDKTEGTAKDVGGSIKEAAGKATGNDDLKHEGQADQVEGKVQKGAGKLQEKLSK